MRTSPPRRSLPRASLAGLALMAVITTLLSWHGPSMTLSGAPRDAASEVAPAAPPAVHAVAVLPALPAPTALPAGEGYQQPLAGPLEVVRPFVPPTTRYGPGHRGVDLAAPVGSTVLAANAGVVGFAGALAGRIVVSIRHADGLLTTYEPLAELSVRSGATVSAGAALGTLIGGHPGCAAPPGQACLHWGARNGDGYLDPLSLLRRPQIVLLTPVTP